MSEPAISVENLSVERGDQTILCRVNWRVEAGDHWVVLGANGSGKTSLLRAITGYLTPTRGTVRVLGEEYGASDWRELRKRIGLVSSSIAQMIPPEDTALEIVAGGRQAEIGIWQTPPAADQRRALGLLRHLRSGALASRPWLYLSQGERQRVLIARALMPGPAVLILDEPCAGLDPVARRRFLHDLETFGASAKGPSMVLVTHHVEEIPPSFSHVLALRGGRVLTNGPKARVLTGAEVSRIFGEPFRLRRSGGWFRMVT